MSKIVLACLLGIGLSALAQEQSSKEKTKVYSIKEDPSITPPKLIFKEEPKYTDAAKEAKAQGTVLIRVEVTEKGLPENIVVLSGIHPDLDKNAAEAVRNWRFEPALKEGTPVRVRAEIEINFRLS